MDEMAVKPVRPEIASHWQNYFLKSMEPNDKENYIKKIMDTKSNLTVSENDWAKTTEIICDLELMGSTMPAWSKYTAKIENNLLR